MAHARGECPGWSPGAFLLNAHCRRCWRTRNPATCTDPGWKGGPAQFVRVPVETVPARPDCIELGPALPGQTCGCAEKLRRCGTHDTCTTGTPRPGVACCRTCPDYDDGRVVDAGTPTIAVTHWNRPAELGRLLASIAAHLPGWPTLVEDTGGNLSAGRQRLYARVTTPYLVIMEEDFVVLPRTRAGLLDAVAILDHDPHISGVGGTVNEGPRGRVQWGHDFFEKSPGVWAIRASTRPKRRTPAGLRYRPCDLVLNWGVFRTPLYRSVPWDADFPITEHKEWYWRASRAGHEFAFYPALNIDHRRARPNEEYVRGRNRNFSALTLRKHGIRFANHV
jgi:hypothetical protein